MDPESDSSNPSPDFAAEALGQQYNSVFAVPRPAWRVDNFQEHFREVDGDSLADIQFSQEDIQQA
jgi:hypothetical protein